MASKKYRCKVELTTRPQADGKRLTFKPGEELEAKVLLRDQIEKFLAKGVIEEIRKSNKKDVPVIAEDGGDGP